MNFPRRKSDRKPRSTLVTSLVWQAVPAKAEEARAIREAAVGRGVWENPLQYPADFTPGIRGSTPWPVVDEFPRVAAAAALLEGHWEAIRDEFTENELISVAQDQFEAISTQSQSEPAARWAVLPAFHEGEACGCGGRGCATVCRLLPRLQRHVSVTGIMFSIVGSGAHLRPHYGPNNRRLKLHLVSCHDIAAIWVAFFSRCQRDRCGQGLIVPQPTRMRIGTETRSWAEGKCNFLDDSFDHEVSNESGENRVVLEVIFDRPK